MSASRITIPVVSRVAPSPISSGMSFRTLPEPSLAQIIKTCLHYEEKCAGMYDSKSPAARYLYDLSREVQDMARICKVTGDAAHAKVRELEYILQDWNEIFASPSSTLQAAGITRTSNAPSAVARRIQALADTVRAIEVDTLSQRVSLEKEVADLRSALREASRVAREQAAQEFGKLKREADTAIAQERALRDTAISDLDNVRRTIDSEIRAGVSAEVASQTAALRAELARVRSEAERDVSAAAAAAGSASADAADAARALEESARAKEVNEQAHAAEVGNLQQQIHALKEELRSSERESAKVLAETEQAWRSTLLDAHDTWTRSTGAVRTHALEAQIAFLSERVQTLQDLWNATQQAFSTGHGIQVQVQQQPQQQQQRGSSAAVNNNNNSMSSSSMMMMMPPPPVLPRTGIPASSSGVSSTTTIRFPSPLVAAAPRGTKTLKTIATVRHAGIDALGGGGGSGSPLAPTETRYLSVR